MKKLILVSMCLLSLGFAHSSYAMIVEEDCLEQVKKYSKEREDRVLGDAIELDHHNQKSKICKINEERLSQKGLVLFRMIKKMFISRCWADEYQEKVSKKSEQIEQYRRKITSWNDEEANNYYDTLIQDCQKVLESERAFAKVCANLYVQQKYLIEARQNGLLEAVCKNWENYEVFSQLYCEKFGKKFTQENVHEITYEQVEHLLIEINKGLEEKRKEARKEIKRRKLEEVKKQKEAEKQAEIESKKRLEEKRKKDTQEVFKKYLTEITEQESGLFLERFLGTQDRYEQFLKLYLLKCKNEFGFVDLSEITYEKVFKVLVGMVKELEENLKLGQESKNLEEIRRQKDVKRVGKSKMRKKRKRVRKKREKNPKRQKKGDAARLAELKRRRKGQAGRRQSEKKKKEGAQGCCIIL